MADADSEMETLKQMVMSFRVQELHTLLSSAGVNKLGRKSELQTKAIELLNNPVTAYRRKIRDLYSKLAHAFTKGSVQYHPEQSSSERYRSSAQSTRMACQQQQQDILPSSKYPIHPDVKFQNLPFYSQLAELLKPSSLIFTTSRKLQDAEFEFHLTPQQAKDIAISCSKSDYTIQVQMRFCLLETSCPQEDCFPPCISVRVNGKICSLPAPIPTNKQGVQPKRPRLPVNITSLVKLSPTLPNNILVSWSTEYGQGYVIAVFLVQKLASTDLLYKLRAKGVRHRAVTIGTIHEKLMGDTDCELATSSLRVSLLCPLGKSRMITPCRATTCNHLQCFDASLYLQMNEKKSTWICPVCNQQATYDNLVVDGYFHEILASSLLPPDCKEIVIREDGLWSPKETREQSPIPEPSVVEVDDDELMIIDVKPMKPIPVRPVKEASVIDLTLSDEEEEEEETPHSPNEDKLARQDFANPDSSTGGKETLSPCPYSSTDVESVSSHLYTSPDINVGACSDSESSTHHSSKSGSVIVIDNSSMSANHDPTSTFSSLSPVNASFFPTLGSSTPLTAGDFPKVPITMDSLGSLFEGTDCSLNEASSTMITSYFRMANPEQSHS